VPACLKPNQFSKCLNLLVMSLELQFLDAVDSKDNEKVSYLLDKMTDEDGLSALCAACVNNNIHALNLLVAKPGIDVNANLRDGDGHTVATPILLAAELCNIKTLEVMLRSPHVDLDVKCVFGMGLEDYVGGIRGSEEDKKKCLDMIREEKLKRMKVSESEESEKMKRVNLREGDNNCSGDTKQITKDQHLKASEDSSASANLSSDPATAEELTVKFARILFDATDMGEGLKTLKCNAATPMTEIKKLFPKHLGVADDTFMLCFKNQELKEETPLELFGSDLDGDGNVIRIVKAVIEDRGAFCDKLETERETDQIVASDAQNGQKDVNEVKKANRISFKWLGSKMNSQHTQPVRIKPKCVRASCLNQGQHRCTRCRAVYYCKQDCLSEDWSHHKSYCDYVYKASKDYAYEENRIPDDSAFEENSVPDDSANKDPEEMGISGGTVEEVD